MEDRAKTGAEVRWLNDLARPHRLLLVPAVGFPLLSGLLLLAQAWTLAGVLHAAIVEHTLLVELLPSVGVLASLLAVRAGLAMGGEILSVRLAEAIKAGLRRSIFADLMTRRPIWSATKSSGSLSSTAVEQVEALDGYFARYLPALVQAGLLPIAFAVVILPVDWIVAVLFLVTAPLIPVFMALAGWGAEAASRSQASALGRLSALFADRLRGLLTLKLFGEADREIDRVRAASEELRMRTMKVMRIAFLSSAVLEFFAALGVAGVALYVGLTFLDLVSLRGGAELTLAAGMFCLLMAPEVYQPLRLLAAHYHDRAAAKAAVAAIADELEGLPDQTATADRTAPTPLAATGAAQLELAGLLLRAPYGPILLDRVDLMAEPEDTIAVLGASGIGKSTLLEAIAGLRPYIGSIRLDEKPLAEFAEADLRRRVAMLGQRPRLFPGTIADNIRLGRPDADDAAIRRAATMAHVTDFVDLLPDGMATRLGEDGLGLSGGEIQRLALARIYLRDPGLILLDEPTGHLDAATEAAVLDGLREFATGRTLVIATHSLAVAARMDKVYRIGSGRLLPTPKPSLRLPRSSAA